MTGNEFINFVLLSMAFVGVVGALGIWLSRK